MQNPDIPSLDGLAKKYPLIFRAFHRSSRYPKNPFAHRGYECGDGWYSVLDELSAWLEAEAETLKAAGKRVPVVVQVKEKFGSLRFYVSQFPTGRFLEELLPRIVAAQLKSATTCEVCGLSGTMRHGGYLQTLCDTHAHDSDCESEA